MAQIFAKPRLMRFGGISGGTVTYNSISDHNRTELSISSKRIGTSQRMVNGTMRNYFVADKRTFSTSWDMLPNRAAYTVDGFWGADDLEDFYRAQPGAFHLELTYSNGPVEDILVMFTDFSMTLQKRGRYDFYSVTLTMEEV
jgi:hypothetical protein